MSGLSPTEKRFEEHIEDHLKTVGYSTIHFSEYDSNLCLNGNNTEENKKNFFKQQFDGMMIDYINERFDFYKKMDDNPSMKSLIFQMMYKDYQTKGPLKY
jgi:hypothetical protein